MTRFITFTLLFISCASIASEQLVKIPSIGESGIQFFCTGKPIWSAFGIETPECIKATQHCAKKPEFAELDPGVLSEDFYQCVFQQLGIEAE